MPTYSICNLLGSNRCMTEFFMARIKDFVQSHQGLYFPHRHDFYQIVLFTQGGGRHSIDFQNIEIVPGQVYYMSPGQIHIWDFDEKTDGYIINFHESFFSSVYQNVHYVREFPLFNPITTLPVNNLPPENHLEMDEIFAQIFREYTEAKDYRSDILRSLLTTILVKLSRIAPKYYKEETNKHNLVLMHQFGNLIEQYFHEKHFPKEYAELMFVSPNYLNALTNAIVGMSAGNLIRERILLEAKRLLVNSDLLIGQIADKLHFEDNAYFTRFFKKHTGATPENFRMEFLSKSRE